MNGKKEVVVELWQSTANQRELHYFVNKDEYVFGYNPKHFTEQEINKFLSTKFKIGGLRKRKQ